MDENAGSGAENNIPSWRKRIGLFSGPILALLFFLLVDLDPARPAVSATAAVALWMALWWISEAVPLSVTALLPVVLFPLTGVMSGRRVCELYFNDVIFLFIGGFIVAMAMERWKLHIRIALHTLRFFGVRPKRMVLGFMVVTALLSMWISNTATAMMMVPIALSVIIRLEEMVGKAKVKSFSTGLLLAIAYGASIGGVATLVGTPPNIAFARIFAISFPAAPEISFARWMLYGLPVSLVFLLISWGVLSLLFCRDDYAIDPSTFREQIRRLPPLSFEEKIVLVDFSLLALLWMTRAELKFGYLNFPGWASLFGHPEYINDGTVAILLTLPLFFIPARDGGMIMKRESIRRLPWNIILLFGGGFALAGGFTGSGLSAWLGERLIGLGGLHPVLLVGIICLFINFLTELTSNTATAQMILPLIASLSVAVGRNPLLYMIPATISCSFAFMLPVATPPNAIIFGTDRISIGDMVRTGLLLELLGAIVITGSIFLLGRIFGIDPSVLPPWAVH